MSTAKHTLRFRAMRMRPWLVMRRKGVLPRSWSSLSMASASIRRLCQLISLNVNTWNAVNYPSCPSVSFRNERWKTAGGGGWKGTYLSSLRVGDAGVAEVTALPFRVEAVSLELPELKGGMKGTSLHFDGDGVDPDGHPLHHLLRKAILAANRKCHHKQTGCSPHVSENVRRSIYLCPAVMAIGEGPLGGRGSSQVLISTSTLSKNWARTQKECLRLTERKNNIKHSVNVQCV